MGTKKFMTCDVHSGVGLIAAERDRQIEKEGWDTGHDLEHEPDALAIAAACYAVNKTDERHGYLRVVRFNSKPRDPKDCGYKPHDPGDAFPFYDEFDKRAKHDRLRSLVIAGALLAAEIDRLQTAQVCEKSKIRARKSVVHQVSQYHLLAITLLYILRSTEKTVYESIGAPLPGDSRIVQFVCHRQHMLLGIVLYSSAYAELMPDDPVPVLDVRVIGTVAREVRLTEFFAPSVN